MYKQYVNQVKDKHPLYLIFIPILMIIVSVLLINGFWNVLITLLLGRWIDTDNILGIGALLEMVLTFFTTLWLIKKVSGFSVRDLGFLKTNFMKYYLIGALGGILSILFVFLVNILFGGVHTTFVFEPKSLFAILVALVFFLFQGMYEELLFRLYLMPHFSKAGGHIFAIITTAFLFMLLHGLNSGVNLLAFLNLLLFGIIMALIYYYTGNAWIIGAIHSLWNFVLGPIVGSNVSGGVAENTVFLSTPQPGHFLLNGGIYGLEGGIITTLVGIVVLIYFLYRQKFKQLKP
ncbi:CPBP family intramembrane glutamic endopeptidase [Staphylococcus delphini]|uniref:CPBP family intramembrane glutamic endopeptidase n=1 Tax=Staphylococcus delphini TaxID=53344 RepID=UPI000BBCB66B|nr:type II CAAX endopeptidase family protein [Staphylococcus delphini]PCF41203.1 hypothetical protein B5C06_08855 [Staphylococcus delphini]